MSNKYPTEKIRKLRSQGLTYSEINKDIQIKVPKSTLAYICKNVALPPQYQKKIDRLNQINGVRGHRILTKWWGDRRAKLMKTLTNRNKHLVGRLDTDTQKIALSMLYLGEGAKWKSHRGLQLGSSDQHIIRLYLRLLQRCYRIPLTGLRCRISYRADQDKDQLQRYWSRITGIPLKNFYRTKPDPRTLGRPTRKKNYRGVCVVSGGSTEIQLELDHISKIILSGP